MPEKVDDVVEFVKPGSRKRGERVKSLTEESCECLNVFDSVFCLSLTNRLLTVEEKRVYLPSSLGGFVLLHNRCQPLLRVARADGTPPRPDVYIRFKGVASRVRAMSASKKMSPVRQKLEAAEKFRALVYDQARHLAAARMEQLCASGHRPTSPLCSGCRNELVPKRGHQARTCRHPKKQG